MRASLPPLGLPALALLCACASTTYDQLPARDSLPLHRELASRSGELPARTGRAAGISFRRTSADASDWLVVMVHGVLSDRRAWTYVAGDLGQDHDLLLLDLPGCGASDKPWTPETYAPDAMARAVYAVLREQLTDRPQRIALVGHSLGSMIILRMLGDEYLRAEYADVRAHVERAVLLSPVDFAVEKKHPVFERIIGLSGFEVQLADLLALLQESAGRTVANGADASRRVPREEAQRLVEILRDPRTRFAAQEMLSRAVPFTTEERPDWPRIERLVDDYGNVDVPTALVVGGRDETFPAAMSFKLAAQLPNAELTVLPRCMHALPSEAPRECAGLIRAWLGAADALARAE